MHTENEGTLELSHKRSKRFLERRRGSRPLQSLSANRLPPLVFLGAEEYRRQHPDGVFIPHKRKHIADFAVQVDKENRHDENYSNKIPRIDKSVGKSATKEHHTRRSSILQIRSQTLAPAPLSSYSPPTALRSSRSPSAAPLPSDPLPAAPLSSRSPPAVPLSSPSPPPASQSSQAAAAAPLSSHSPPVVPLSSPSPPPASQSSQASPPALQSRQSPPPVLQSPHQQHQSPPAAQSPQQQHQSSQQPQSPPPTPPVQSPQQQLQSNKSADHHDTAPEMGGIPDDFDFEFDIDFGDNGASVHEEQEDRRLETTNEKSTPSQQDVAYNPKVSAHSKQGDQPVTRQQEPTAVYNDEENRDDYAATSSESDIDQQEIMESLLEKLAQHKVHLYDVDAADSIEMIKDKLHDAILDTDVKITGKTAFVPIRMVQKALEVIQTAVANATNIQDDMVQNLLQMFLDCIMDPLGVHLGTLRNQQKFNLKIKRVRRDSQSVRVKSLSAQQQVRKIREEADQLNDARKKIQKERESYMEIKGLLDALDNIS
ncbi:hypothetical protein LRAMOSA07191 [Lichtheimia ramosa]|uniref:Uncharacterized protein n=1 Tax=Lichtheimia ramosa TaxID=688394 RepID=A0A077WB67_9FUNG|nr:hypothetical protein LRAMOSA07191 [Lichtheimia ramosa]